MTPRTITSVVLRTLKVFGVGIAAGLIIVTILFILSAPDREVAGILSADLWIWGVMAGLGYVATAGGLLGSAVGLVYALLMEVDSRT